MITLIENVGAINKSIRQTKIDDKSNQIIFDEFMTYIERLELGNFLY